MRNIENTEPSRQIIYAGDFDIFPEKEISKELAQMLSQIFSGRREKTVLFEKGTYYIDSEQCQKKMQIMQTGSV